MATKAPKNMVLVTLEVTESERISTPIQLPATVQYGGQTYRLDRTHRGHLVLRLGNGDLTEVETTADTLR
jgi:hypothetical protein